MLLFNILLYLKSTMSMFILNYHNKLITPYFEKNIYNRYSNYIVTFYTLEDLNITKFRYYFKFIVDTQSEDYSRYRCKRMLMLILRFFYNDNQVKQHPVMFDHV